MRSSELKNPPRPTLQGLDSLPPVPIGPWSGSEYNLMKGAMTSNGSSVTWKWIAVTLTSVIILIGAYMYKAMADDVSDIKAAVTRIEVNLAQYKVTQDHNSEAIKELKSGR